MRESSWTRRGTMKSISALGATITIPQLASAQSGEVGIESADITEDYFNLLDRYKFGEARELLRKNNVSFTSKKYTHSGEGASTEDNFKKGSASVDFTVVKVGGNDDRFLLQLNWSMSEQSFDIDSAGPKDIAALGWKSDTFRAEDDSVNHNGVLAIIDEDTGEVRDSIDATSLEKEPPLDVVGGAEVKVNDIAKEIKPNLGEQLQVTGYSSVRLERTEDTSGVVGGTYSHAWSPLGLGKHTTSLDFGVLSIKTGISVDNWELPSKDERDQTV